MVDIWMLFTMTVPFFEVVYHTSNEIFKQSDVDRVLPLNLSGEAEMPNNNMKVALLRRTQRLGLPVISFLFTIIFWIVGLIASYFSVGASQDSNVSNCLMIDLN